mmetsp:Transcript_3845/g.11867  ORF Transcript_3845/g.11867 Transcript_3845/m.11867 type:complete len:216 (+) Transcript_3845:345-992(+)
MLHLPCASPTLSSPGKVLLSSLPRLACAPSAQHPDGKDPRDHLSLQYPSLQSHQRTCYHQHAACHPILRASAHRRASVAVSSRPGYQSPVNAPLVARTSLPCASHGAVQAQEIVPHARPRRLQEFPPFACPQHRHRRCPLAPHLIRRRGRHPDVATPKQVLVPNTDTRVRLEHEEGEVVQKETAMLQGPADEARELRVLIIAPDLRHLGWALRGY